MFCAAVILSIWEREMCTSHRRKIGLIILIVGVFHGCSLGSSAEDDANEMIAAMNAGDTNAMWEFVSFDSRHRLAQQLSNNQNTASGRRLLRNSLGLDDAQIDTLTPRDYFGILMKADPGFGIRKVEILGVDVDGDTAKAYYRADDAEGVTNMVKEQGQWRMVAEVE